MKFTWFCKYLIADSKWVTNLKFFWVWLVKIWEEQLKKQSCKSIRLVGVEEVEGKLTRFVEESSRGGRGRGAFLG